MEMVRAVCVFWNISSRVINGLPGKTYFFQNDNLLRRLLRYKKPEIYIVFEMVCHLILKCFFFPQAQSGCQKNLFVRHDSPSSNTQEIHDFHGKGQSCLFFAIFLSLVKNGLSEKTSINWRFQKCWWTLS